MAESDKNLRAYFDKLLEIQKAQENRPLSEEELKQIASNLGLSDSDWEAVETTYQSHFVKGQGFLEYQNWDDAIHELKQAVMLKPNALDALYSLAHAYQARWYQTGSQEDKALAEKYARQCLNLRADHRGAIQLISDLKKKTKPTNQAGESVSSNTAGRIIALSAIMGMVLIAGMVFFIVGNQVDRAKEQTEFVQEALEKAREEGAIPSDPEPATTPSAPLKIVQTPEPPDVFLEDRQRAIPVTFTKEGRGKNLIFVSQNSILDNFGESHSYTLNADIVPQGIEVDKLRLKIDLINSAGEVFFTTIQMAVDDYQPIVQSGDAIPFNYLKYEESQAPDLKEVLVTAYAMDAQPAPASYRRGKQVKLHWPNRQKPDNYDLEVTERRSKYEKMTYGDKEIRHELVLAFKNTGQRYIEKLSVNIEWLGAGQKVLETKNQIIVLASEPKLLNNQVRSELVIGKVDVASVKDVKGYRVTVNDIN